MTNLINRPLPAKFVLAKQIGSDKSRAEKALESAGKTGKAWKKAKTKSSYIDALAIREIRDYRKQIHKLDMVKPSVIAKQKTAWGQNTLDYEKQKRAERIALNQLNAVAIEFGLASNWASKNYDNDLAFVSAFRDWVGRQLKKQGCVRDSHTSKKYGKVTSAYYFCKNGKKTIRVSDHQINSCESKGRLSSGWSFGPDLILDLDTILSKRREWWDRVIILAANGRSDSFDF